MPFAMMTFSLTAQLPSGKNSVLVTRTGQRIPSPRFVEWRRQAAKEVLTQVTATEKPLRGPCGLRVSYVPQDRRRRDVSGQLDCLFHLLEYCGLVQDDSQIHGVVWTRDRDGPHTRIALLPLTPGVPFVRW